MEQSEAIYHNSLIAKDIIHRDRQIQALEGCSDDETVGEEIICLQNQVEALMDELYYYPTLH